jgi:hypothetical protein
MIRLPSSPLFLAPAWSLSAALLLLAACGEETAAPVDAPATESANALNGAVVVAAHEGHEHGLIVAWDSADDLSTALDAGDGMLHFDTPQGVEQLGFMFDADHDVLLEATGFTLAGERLGPMPVDVTWSEGALHAGRLLFGQPVAQVEISGALGLDALRVELLEETRANPELPTAAQLPFVEESPRVLVGDDLGQVSQGATLPSFVVTRSAWGARNPSAVCGDAHTPSMITIHHTVTPTAESDVPARMRQTQAYHIDSNGWCDIGYHFLIGQDGRVYQGRSSEERTGAHAGGANFNNVGVSYLGTYTTDVPNDSMFTAGAQIVRWLSDTFGITLNRQNVKGHREVGTTSTECPGNALYPRIQRIIDEALGGGTTPDPDPTYAVTLDARWSGLSDIWTGGSSAGVSDAFPDDRVVVEFLLTNNSPEPIRGVELGYFFENPWLTPVDWKIESDYPAYDRATWAVNSADSSPSNPARDALGGTGFLVMDAFSPRETKRVTITLKVGDPSIGRVDQPDARVWLRNITGIYGPQTDFFTAPSNNSLGRNVNDYVELDILSTDAWFFDETGSDADIEGWSVADSSMVEAAQQNGEGMLAIQARGPAPSVESPAWTELDADRFTELVVASRSHDGARTMQLYWARSGQEWNASRSVQFAAAGDSSIQQVRALLGEHPEWYGTITALRLVPAIAAPVGATDRRWHDVDYLYFQNDAGETSDPRVRASTAPATETTWPDGTDEPVGPDAGPGPDAGTGADAGSFDTGADAGTIGPDGSSSPDVSSESDAGEFDVSGGGRNDDDDRPARDNEPVASSSSCSASPSSSGWTSSFYLLLLLGLRRRRRQG